MTPLTLQSAEAPAARRCQGVLLSTLGSITSLTPALCAGTSNKLY